MRGGELYLLAGSQFILWSFSHFETQDFKNSKKKLPAAPSFSIFTFSDLKQMQGFK